MSSNPLQTANALALVSNIVNRSFLAAALQRIKTDLTPTQFAGLRFVALHPGGCIRELAQSLQVSHPAAVKLAERLVDRGLVRRETAPDDHRRVCLQLTAAGRRVYKDVFAAQQGLIGQVLDRMGSDAASELHRLSLEFVRSSIETEEQIAQTCLYCGIHHRNDCPVSSAEELLTGLPRSAY
jgi:DNA-binding MarR family transcriptional regulator